MLSHGIRRTEQARNARGEGRGAGGMRGADTKIHSSINTYGGGTYADTALKTAMRTDVKKMRKNKKTALLLWTPKVGQ